ncbi:hypothetical protein LXL04_038301 [Taraxacum kok-saghyz]
MHRRMKVKVPLMLTDFYKSVVKSTNSKSRLSNQESTSTSKILMPNMKSYSNNIQSSLRLTLEKSTKPVCWVWCWAAFGKEIGGMPSTRTVGDLPPKFTTLYLYDTSRNYQPLPMIKKVIDSMAYTKLASQLCKLPICQRAAVVVERLWTNVGRLAKDPKYVGLRLMHFRCLFNQRGVVAAPLDGPDWFPRILSFSRRTKSVGFFKV